MANFEIQNILIEGVAAAVPVRTLSNTKNSLLTSDEANKFIQTTGIRQVHVSPPEICTSDLCFRAAQQLFDDLKIDKQDIDVLIFVSQTPDYILPITASILQNRLGLSKSCMAFDITLGCSGYVYGLSIIASILSSGKFRYGLLLAGDTISKVVSKNDKSTMPLFGDAGSATLVKYDVDNNSTLKFGTGTDGGGFKAIIIPDGGARNPISSTSTELKTYDKGIERSNINLSLDGMDVFTFGISEVPRAVKEFMGQYNLADSDIDYYLFHQANLMMNEQIRKKLKIEPTKVPYSLSDFGNTSSATIPITIVSQLYEYNRAPKLLLCGFGVGLSWATAYVYSTRAIHISKLIEI